MRIAYYSPLRPQPSGISDYSEALLPHLAALAEVTLFVDGFEPTSPAVREFAVRDFNTTEPKGQDVCLYHIGNNADFHAGIYGQACRRPGVVVLHEWVLHNLFAGVTIRRNDTAAYVREMEYNYGRFGHALAQEFFGGGVPPVWEVSPEKFPLNRRVIERSLGVIAHSRFVADRVRAANALVPVARVPHGMAVRPPGDVRALRRRHGVPLERPVVATFGFVNPWKRLDVIAGALARLVAHPPHPPLPFRERVGVRVVTAQGDLTAPLTLPAPHRGEGAGAPHCQPLFLVVGRVAGDYDARRVVAEAGLREVKFVEPAGLVEFEAFIDLCDIAINLRCPTLGETSGAVLRVLAAGRPCIVSDVGWFGELPDDCVAKVPPEPSRALAQGGHPAEEDLIVGYLERLLGDADLRRRMGANARAYVAREHSWKRAAEGYVTFLERVLREPRRHVRADEVVRQVARELADMGLPADDESFIPDVARELAELSEPADDDEPAKPVPWAPVEAES